MRPSTGPFRAVSVPGMAVLALAVSTGCDGGSPALDVVAVDPGHEPGDVDPGTDRDNPPDCNCFDAPDDRDIPPDEIPCVATCGDRECGPDGCGGTCGSCDEYSNCYESSGVCVPGEYPNCTDRVCGGDGVGGTCGTCAEGTSCAEADGQCIDNCDWATDKPTTWGPTGVVSTLQTPSDKTVVAATCFDYTGEGAGDNGLKGLAGQINGPLATLVEAQTTSILFEAAGVTDFLNATFQLNGLIGQSASDPPASSGDFQVQEASYQMDICAPMISFKNATITNGVLAAGPSVFQLSIPVQEGLVIDATLVQARLKGNVVNGDATTGFELTDGVLSGVLTKEQLVAAVAKLQATCDTAPTGSKPDFCGYLSVGGSAMALLFDLHQNRDGDGIPDGTYSVKSKDLPGDAASVCLTYALSKAKIIGFVPAAD